MHIGESSQTKAGRHCARIIARCGRRWLRKDEVHFLLTHLPESGLRVQSELPLCPGSGTLLLFNKLEVRHYRKDGLDWKKKKDGKTVREDHERLKIDGEEVLNCCYAHGVSIPTFHRRIYSTLSGDTHFVLVHYFDSSQASGGSDESDDESDGADTSLAVKEEEEPEVSAEDVVLSRSVSEQNALRIGVPQSPSSPSHKRPREWEETGDQSADGSVASLSSFAELETMFGIDESTDWGNYTLVEDKTGFPGPPLDDLVNLGGFDDIAFDNPFVDSPSSGSLQAS